MHTIYITILFWLQLSKTSTPANFSQFKHWANAAMSDNPQSSITDNVDKHR